MGVFSERVHIEPYRVTVAQFRSPLVRMSADECCEVKQFNVVSEHVYTDGKVLVLRERPSAGGGDARQPLLPRSWTASLSSDEGKDYLVSLLLRAGLSGQSAIDAYDALKTASDTHGTGSQSIQTAVSQAVGLNGERLLEQMMRGLASTSQETRFLEFFLVGDEVRMEMTTQRNIVDDIVFDAVLSVGLKTLMQDEPALGAPANARMLLRRERVNLFVKQPITVASETTAVAFDTELTALDPFILRVKKADSRVKLAHGWWASNRERLLPGFEPHPHPGNIFMQKLDHGLDSRLR